MPRVSSGWVQQALNSADIQLIKQRRAELSAQPHTAWKNPLKLIKFLHLHVPWISFQLRNISATQAKQHAQRVCAFALVFVSSELTVQGFHVISHEENNYKLSEQFKQNHVSKTETEQVNQLKVYNQTTGVTIKDELGLCIHLQSTKIHFPSVMRNFVNTPTEWQTTSAACYMCLFYVPRRLISWFPKDIVIVRTNLETSGFKGRHSDCGFPQFQLKRPQIAKKSVIIFTLSSFQARLDLLSNNWLDQGDPLLLASLSHFTTLLFSITHFPNSLSV